MRKGKTFENYHKFIEYITQKLHPKKMFEERFQSDYKEYPEPQDEDRLKKEENIGRQ